MIRVADYIANALAEHGIRHVFLVTGGGAMHLNDAIGRCKRLEYICCHHEQACAMAADSYFRLTNSLAAVNVTTGPGGTNAMTGVFGAWVDSLGMIVISGQVKWETVVRSTGLPLRQLGDQELDIVRLVSPITKYAVMVTDPQTIRYHLEKALYLARSDRPGPVWVDVPMNVQGALVDPDTLDAYHPAAGRRTGTTPAVEAAAEIAARWAAAKRPVVLPGPGIRLSAAHERFLALVERWHVPVATPFNSHDLIWDDHPCFVGRQGTVGDRSGNFAVQNADFLLVLGSQLSIRQVSYNWENFARHAFKAIVDIDSAELRKPTVRPDLAVHADVGEVLDALLALPTVEVPDSHPEWLSWCLARKERYPVVLPEYWDTTAVNPYCFVSALYEQLPEGEVVVTGDGTACVVAFQASRIRRNQRLYTNSGCAPMGYDLPAAVGASIAGDHRRVICLAGDGSIQMNLQELQTIATHRLPIKVFVLNNHGYLSIRLTQKAYFPDNLVGADPESGVGIPSFEKLAAAYGFPYVAIHKTADLADEIARALATEGPTLCEVFLDPTQPFSPKLASRRLPDGRMVSSPLEDMYPFLGPEELRDNMIVPLLGL